MDSVWPPQELPVVNSSPLVLRGVGLWGEDLAAYQQVLSNLLPHSTCQELAPTSFYPALSPLSKPPGQLESLFLKFTNYSLVIAVFIPMSCMAIVLVPLVKSKILISRICPGLPFIKPLPGVLSYSPCLISLSLLHNLTLFRRELRS